MALADRIGVSTISLAGISAEEAIDAVAAGGFRTIEVFAGATTYSAIGHPKLLSPAPGIWPRQCDRDTRRRLADKLRAFDTVTVHAQFEGVNIASPNPGIREESVRQYLECIEFASDIGASILTYHPGSPCRYGHYAHLFAREGHERNLDFARLATERAEGLNLQLGFEGPDGAGWPVVEVVLDAPQGKFGILVDPAQSCLSRMTCEGLLDALRRCRGRIVAVHVHGALARTVGRIAHLPLRLNNIVDWRRVMATLHEVDFAGPLLFEITSSEDPRQVIGDCQESQELLLHCAGGP